MSALLSCALVPLASAEVRSAHVTYEGQALSRARGTASRSSDLAGGAHVLVMEAPFAFTAVAVLANGSSDGLLYVRVSRDGSAWSNPEPLPDEAPNPILNERGEAHPFGLDRVSALYFPGKAKGGNARFLAVEYRDATRPPSRVTLHFIDASTPPRRPARARSVGEDAAVHPLKPALVRREEWGARPPRYAYSLTLAKHFAVHHTASVSDGLAATREECAAQVRAIQAFHQDTRDWNDVGYSYLICGTGEVFQAREDEDDATDLWGAHDGYNRGSMSVSLMGYFHAPFNQTPPPPAIESLVQTLTWMADIRDVDPLAASLYESYGAVRTSIYGHREVRATECPGDIVFGLKDQIRFAVAERLSAYREGTPPAPMRR